MKHERYQLQSVRPEPVLSEVEGPVEGRNKNLLTFGLMLPLLFSLTPTAHSAGGIATDNTLGKPARVISAPNTKANVDILQSDGITKGKNLFHSFSKFNIETGQTVTFRENKVNSLDNVISRVTGGSRSDIDGTLRSTPGGHANFFLINPSGVVFGKNATIDVPAAFHVSTADEMKFKDGSKFSASQPGMSRLSAAAPTAFGFLGSSKSNNGLLVVNGSKLKVKEKQSLDLSANDIHIKNQASLSAPSGRIRLVAIKGKKNLNLDRVLTLPTRIPSSQSAGNIVINDVGGRDPFAGNIGINTSGDNGGRIAISGNNILIKNSLLLSDLKGKSNNNKYNGIEIKSNHLKLFNSLIDIESTNNASGYAGSIDLNSKSSITIMDGGVIGSGTTGFANGSNIKITTDALNIKDRHTGWVNGILAYSDGISLTKSGDILIKAKSLNITNGGEIICLSLGDGVTGNLEISSDNIRVEGISRENYFPSAIGNYSLHRNAGKLNLKVKNKLVLLNGGVIQGSVFSNDGSVGKQAKIYIKSEDLIINNINNNTGFMASPSGIFSGINGGGIAGDIIINTKNLDILGKGAYIDASTTTRGNAGTITIIADKINIDGIKSLSPYTGSSEGLVSLPGDFSTPLGIISGASRGFLPEFGDSGNITIKANIIKLSNGANINTSTRGPGKAGLIDLKANSIILNKESLISSISRGDPSGGNAGDIKIEAKYLIKLLSSTISIENEAFINQKPGAIKISSKNIQLSNSDITSQSNGNAGNIQINADNLKVVGKGEFREIPIIINFNDLVFMRKLLGLGITAITTGNSSTSKAGNIEINANSFKLEDGTRVSSSTLGAGQAGSVVLNADNILIGKDAVVSSASTGVNSSGRTGNINISANDWLKLDSGTISIENEAIGFEDNIAAAITPGSITIQAKAIDMIDSDITSVSTGNAGNIFMTADTIRVDGKGVDTDSPSSHGIAALTTGHTAASKAGSITINADKLELLNSANVSSSTLGAGQAGSVVLNADTIFIGKEAVVASASTGLASSGLTGNIDIHANDWLKLHSATISIENQATGLADGIAARITPGNIDINAHDIQLVNSKISTNSTGNVSAGGIDLAFSGTLSMDPSSISTQANTGDGGDIRIRGGKLIQLANSQITTVSKGGNGGSIGIEGVDLIRLQNAQLTTDSFNGNGGNLDINAENMIMETALIRANTNAVGGSGGNITLRINALIPSGNMLITGGNRPVPWQPGAFGLNIIQAAAPNGLSGTIQTSAPQLNLSGDLANLGAPQFDSGFLSPEYCSLGSGSSLSKGGNGGLLPKGSEWSVY